MDDAFAPPETEATSSAQRQAQNAAVLGIVGMTCHMGACCTSILGTTAGTLMCGVALYLARQLASDDLTGEAKAYANVARWSGTIGLAWGGLVLLLVLAYILFYVALIGVVGLEALTEGL